MVVVEFSFGAEQEHGACVVQVLGGVDGREAADADVADHLAAAGQRLGYRHHRQITAEEPGEVGFLAEGQAPHVGVQPVGADDDVELAGGGMLERHLAVMLDRRDRVAEQVLDVVAAGGVVDLAEVVAHDLHVPVRGGGVDLGEVDLDGPPSGLPRYMVMRFVPVASASISGRTPIFAEISIAGPEQVDGVAAGFAQGRRALDDGDVEAVTGQPVRQHRAGDAGAGDENPHDDLPTCSTFGKPSQERAVTAALHALGV